MDSALMPSADLVLILPAGVLAGNAKCALLSLRASSVVPTRPCVPPCPALPTVCPTARLPRRPRNEPTASNCSRPTARRRCCSRCACSWTRH